MHLIPYRKSSKDVGERIVCLAKDQKLSAYRSFVGKELAGALCYYQIGSDRSDILITFVPRLPKRVRRTGSDQAKEMALGLGKETGIEVAALLKRRGGKEQKKKKMKDRLIVPEGRYRLTDSARTMVDGKTIWLCDDVVTSGASMLTCASLLMQAGAKEVLGVAVCRSEMQEEE